MQPNLTHAERYLSLLDQNPEQHPNRFLFAAFDDKKAGQPPRNFYGALDDYAAELQALNAKGYGIFVGVNATQGVSRNSQDITRVRAIWQEDDNDWRGGLPLVPSLTVQTSHAKFHRYWLLGERWPADDRGRQDFTSVMLGMVEKYGSDANARDISRVLRLPGFYHMKGEPQLVKITDENPRLFRREELLHSFGVELEPFEMKDEATFSDRDIERAIQVIELIPADDRHEWITVGMAFHHATGGSITGFRTWANWSRASRKYNLREQSRAWSSFKERKEPITLASVFRIAKKYQNIAPPKQRHHQWPLGLHPNELTKHIMNSVHVRFQARHTNPSADEWDGLAQIALAVQGMVDGTLAAKFYLSSLAPGVGKTSMVCEAIRQHKETSAIVFLYRCEEIKRLIEDMGLGSDEFAVMVSRTGDHAKLNELGNPDPTKARVLFTTQQRLQMYSVGKTFAEIEQFHYQGKPRQIRVWDEAIMPSTELTLNYYDMLRLLKGCAQNNPPLAQELQAYCDLVRDLPERKQAGIALCLQYLEGVSREEFLSWQPDSDKAAAEALWRMNKSALRWTQDQQGNTILRYENILPAGLAPMLILDASGLQRETYALWATNRGGLQFLPSPQKSYSPLVIHHWDKGSGKSKRIDWEEIADGIVKTIGGLAQDDKILVLHHLKSKHVPDITRLIQDRIGGTHKNVSFCTWGKHTATNEFRDCKHVILAGVLQYPTSTIEARGRGAKGSLPFDEFLEDEHRETRLGEIAHNILQAACRGALRKSEGNKCPGGVSLWVIFSSHPVTGIPQDLLRRVFPGASISDWRPFLKLRGETKRLADLLLTMPGEGWPMVYIQEQLGISDRRNVLRLLKRPDMMEWMNEQGIRHTSGRDLRFEWTGVKEPGPAKVYDKEVGSFELPC